VTLFSVRNSRC